MAQDNIKVIAGKNIDQYPSPDEIKDLLRHFYHHTGEAGLEVLLAELGKVELILIYRKAVDILQHWDKHPAPPAAGTPCGHKANFTH